MDILVKNSTKSFSIRYSSDFKHRICQEYINGKENKLFFERKYKLGHGRILYWLRELGYITMNPKMVYMKPEDKPAEEILPTNNRIKELERELENARLQTEAYRLMIEVAERELQIKIRKK